MVIMGNYAFDSFPTNLVACVDASREPKESSKENEYGKKQEVTLKNLEDKSSPYRVYEIGVQSDKDISNKKLRKNKNKNSYIARRVNFEDDRNISKIMVNMVSSASQYGVFAISEGGVQIMTCLKNAFPLSNGGSVIMIVGDCVITEDDNLWQLKEFEDLNDTESAISIPWFDPPLISPQPAVCAVPVSIKALDLVFQYVFGDSSDSLDSIVVDNKTGGIVTNEGIRKEKSYLRSTTPLCGSSFSVLTYSTLEHVYPQPNNKNHTQVTDLEKYSHHQQSQQPQQQEQKYPQPNNRNHTHSRKVTDSEKYSHHQQSQQQEQKYPYFSPHDYCTLRELILTARPCHKLKEIPWLGSNRRSNLAAGTLSLNGLKAFIVELGCIDSLLFIELRWLILDKLIINDDPCRWAKEAKLNLEVKVFEWCDNALKCVRYHSCTSIESMLLLRGQVTQWMLALSCRIKGLHFDSVIVLRASEYALRSCLSIFLVSEVTLEPEFIPYKVPSIHFYSTSRISSSLFKVLSIGNGECYVEFIHCLSAEEAIHCVRAIFILITFTPLQIFEDIKSEAVSILLSFMKTTEAQCQIGNVEGAKMTSKELVIQRKLLRKAKRMLKNVINLSSI